MKKQSKILSIINIIIIILSVLICGIYTVLYLNEKDYFLMVSSILVAIVPILLYFSDSIIKRKIPIWLKTAIIIFFFISAVIGAIANAYELIPPYDMFVHFSSGLLVSWLFVMFYLHFYKVQNDKHMILFLFSFNAAVAVWWEIIEFTCDLTINKNFQKGNFDTMTDMISAIIGGIIVTVIYLINRKKKTTLE